MLKYIDEIRNYTNDTETIKDVLVVYSDKKYKNSLGNLDTEPTYKTFKEFTETYLDEQLKLAQEGAAKQKQIYNNAISELPTILSHAQNIAKLIDVALVIIIIPLSILLLKIFTDNIVFLITGTIAFEIIKYLISSKTNFNKWLLQSIFNWKVKKSAYSKVLSIDENYEKEVVQFFIHNKK